MELIDKMNPKEKTAIITGSAGFIGHKFSQTLLDEGWRVIGVDSLTDFYDVSLKIKREKMLLSSENYKSIHSKIETPGLLLSIFERERPSLVIHLAAQAGVRHSIENPRLHIQSNILGTFELLEAARSYRPQHILIASSSSVYGLNEKLPFNETDKADNQLSIYAASKKSMESISHSYAHLFNIPITMFRFFTVYGPWGRPDMAYFKFTESIIRKKPIEIFNYGRMKRDFTYIDDLVHSVKLLIDKIPNPNDRILADIDSLSPIAPFRIINIGNSKSIELSEFITALENATGIKAKKKMLPMQPGDVSETWASSNLLKNLVGYTPNTDIHKGVKEFVEWYKEHYK